MHMKDNKGGNQLDMLVKKGELYVEKNLYVKQITPPTASDLFALTPKQMKIIDNFKIVSSEVVQERGSSFQGYAAEIMSIDEVKQMYLKMKKMHPTATHIAWAYRTVDCKGPKNQDCIDDGEHGSSRAILQYMKAHNIFNTVIFMVQYYGGVHLGPDRFPIFVSTAKAAYEALVNFQMDQAQANMPWGSSASNLWPLQPVPVLHPHL